MPEWSWQHNQTEVASTRQHAHFTPTFHCNFSTKTNVTNGQLKGNSNRSTYHALNEHYIRVTTNNVKI